MYDMLISGYTISKIADTFGVTRQRVGQILSEYDTLPDDDTRTRHRMQLEYLIFNAMQIVQAGPGPMVNVKGEPVYDHAGNPVKDYLGVLNAMEQIRKLSDSLRRMDAIDLPRRKVVAEDEAMRQVREYLSKLPRADIEPPSEEP